MHIPEYAQGTWTNHEPRRTRKLLLNRPEIDRLIGKLRESGLTLVPLSVYFSDGWAKVEIGLARGKKSYDKRQDLAKRDADREIAAGHRPARQGNGLTSRTRSDPRVIVRFRPSGRHGPVARRRGTPPVSGMKRRAVLRKALGCRCVRWRGGDTGGLVEGVTGFDFVRCGRGSEPRKPTSSRESVVGKQ